MKLEINEHSLPVFSALDSPVRIKIIQLLSKSKMNQKDLAKELNLSDSIVAVHIKKLEDAGIVKTERRPGKSGLQKIASLQMNHIEIFFPEKIGQAFDHSEIEIPVGQFMNYSAEPSCGMASIHGYIGHLDEPKYFLDPKRVESQIIWLTKGFLEYQLPNYLEPDQTIQLIEFSMELSSEFPFSNDNWPSDITFFLNEKDLGTWTSPGDFADTRGKNNPDWWPDNMNQYGALKTVQVTNHGTYINGEKISNYTVHDFENKQDYWKIRIEVKEDAENVGGLTIFGKEFGDYPQDIKFKIYYNQAGN